MNTFEIKYCPCTLAEGFDTYSPAGLRLLFDRKRISHLLDFDAPGKDKEIAERLRQNSKTISISGAQFKQSLVIEKGKLRLTEPGESGKYILKPIPLRPPFDNENELPANEHLTMQIARQVYGIQTAECALVFFTNGEPAYITRRFDYAPNGSKIAQEDFASLTGRTKVNDGENYRHSGSYEDVAKCMKMYVPAYAVEIEKLFERIIFNYLFCNGDAHLKNFSLRQTPSGDYILSPAYDLLNTLLHIPGDSFFALTDGLFANDYYTESFQVLGFYAYDDFYEFGVKTGMLEKRIKLILNKYRTKNEFTLKLITTSFLSPEAKEFYIHHYLDRLSMLNNSFMKRI
ncbi:MAG: HipA domain-containing protein [Bacteroidia bacterium]|jgi:serine/threonine-protein kinase HipA|nr:HipA domain-containing protein [Bacteroidia bacterium]